MSSKVVLDAPTLGDIDKYWVNRAIDSGYVSTHGPFVGEFEAKFSEFVGSEAAVATQSGTAALHIALMTSGVGPGDAVLIPNLTFVATANAVSYLGAKPIPVEVNKQTWAIDHESVEQLISDKTKCIIPVHLYGNPSQMDRLQQLKHKHNLLIIEDAAESLGATFENRQTGIIGDLGCYSFNGNKIITTGGGGMVVGKKSQIEEIRYLINQARDNSEGFQHSAIGYNYRMTNLQAALGLAQLSKLSHFLTLKRRFREIYVAILGNYDQLEFQQSTPGALSSHWFTAFTASSAALRGKIQEHLHSYDIPTRRVFTPINMLAPYYQNEVGFPVSKRIYETGLCLPSSTQNSESQIEQAAQLIKQILDNGTRSPS